MRPRLVLTTLTFWLTTAASSVAFAQQHAQPMARYVVEHVPPPAAAPEIDGPGGIAAIALLVSVGMIAYNRFRRK